MMGTHFKRSKLTPGLSTRPNSSHELVANATT
jgi:hypothetical protein